MAAVLLVRTAAVGVRHYRGASTSNPERVTRYTAKFVPRKGEEVMMRHRTIITGTALLALLAGPGVLCAQAQTTTQKTKGSIHVESTRMTGVVDWIQGNTLVVKMRPHGEYRVFIVPADREFDIDGQIKHVGDIKRGTVLTATVLTTTQPVTVRTTSSLSGTVAWVQGNYVVLTLENGENHEYHVPASFKFVVDGKPASVAELKQGMKVSATKIVEQPHTELSSKMTVTGTAPK